LGGGITPLGSTGTDTNITVVLTSSGTPSTVDQQVTLTATVTGDSTNGSPTGNVIFAIDSGGGTTTAISDCTSSEALTDTGSNNASTAACTTQQLPAGSLNLQAQYQGDSNYEALASTDLPQTVNQSNSTVTLSTPPPATSTVDQSVAIGATVSPNPAATTVTDTVAFSGTMNFKNTGTAISGCGTVTPLFDATTGTATASCTTSALTAGNYSITAGYNGDANYNLSPDSNPSTLQVNPAATVVTVTSVTPSSPAVDQGVTINATVAPSVGSVVVPFSGSSMSFYADTVAITGCSSQPVNGTAGTASCTYTGLTAGSHNITATYNTGDLNYNTGTSSNFSLTVNKANTTTTVNSISPTSPTVDQGVTITATVAPSSGSVVAQFSSTMSFSIGGSAITSCGSQAVNATTGVATCTVSGLAVGSQNITATYNSGDSNYNTSTSGNFAATVAKADSQTALTASPTSASANQSVTLTAVVSPNVTPAPTPANTTSLAGNVSFSDNGTVITGCSAQAATFSSTTGTATATCTTSALSAGTHSNLTATFQGNSSYNASPASAAASVTVSKATPSMAVTSNPAAPALNQSVSYTASITFPTPLTITPTGTVSFSDNGTPINNCSTQAITVTGTANIYQATCTEPSLTGGSHAIIASYTGDTNYNTSSGNLSLSIASASTTTTVVSSQNPSTINSSIVFTVSVTGGTSTQVTGTATVIADGNNNLGQCTLANWSSTTGIASCTVATTALALGTHSIVA
jgi:large repetitive protein